MSSSKATASRYGSVHNINGLLGSEHHRRTSSMKRPYTEPTTLPSSIPTHTYAHPDSVQRFSSWKFPATSQGHNAPSEAQSSPFNSNSEAGLNRIEESGSDDSDDTLSSSSDGSPTSTVQHRTSPSLPYGPLMAPYSSAYNQRHGSPLFRVDRASLLHFFQSHLHQLKPLQASYALLFFSCLFIFFTALTGIGYQPAPIQTIPLPPAEVPILIPREAVYEPPAVAQPSHSAAAVRKLYDDIKPIQPPTRRVEPLKAQRLENDVPLIITDDNDPPEEQLPAWARSKAARRRKPVEQAPAAPEQAPAQAPVDSQQPQLQVFNDQPAFAHAAENESMGDNQQEQQSEWQDEPQEDVDQIIEDDLQHLRQLRDGVLDDDQARLQREEYATPEPEEEGINDSPADPALDDEHAAHYHHADEANIFRKAPTNPHDHDHAHHGADTPVEDESTDFLSDDEQTHHYELELNDDGQYIVKTADDTAEEEAVAVPDSETAEEDEVEYAHDFHGESERLRRAIHLR